MKHLSVVVAVGLMMVLAACGQDSKVQSRLTELEREVNELKNKVSLIEMMSDWDEIAYLTPGGSGYSVVKTNIGMLTVSLDNIQSYANGSKITLIIGNPTAATIDGVMAKIEWGPCDKKGNPDNTNAKSKEVTFNESLKAAGWTKINTVLDGVPPAQLGFVRVRNMGHTGIRLLR